MMSERIKVTIKATRIYKLPALPNFLISFDDRATPIGDFSNEQLREVAEQWTKELIRKAEIKRGEDMMVVNAKLGNFGE